MGIWIAKGALVGGFVGCVLSAIGGYLLGGLMGSLASLPSMGSPDLVRGEAVRLAAYGALAGVVFGSAFGGFVTAIGRDLSGTVVGSFSGALLLALYGALLGSVRVNNAPFNLSKMFVLAACGAVLGGALGTILGWVASPLAGRLIKSLKGGW